METLDLKTTVESLGTVPFCLWVGAGVSVQLSGRDSSFLWKSLVERLETEANLTAPPFPVELSERLDVCLRSLGREAFQQHLRAAIHTKMARSLVELAKACTATKLVPEIVRQLAKLGRRANPIVNFNIEAWSSELLARPTGPHAIRCFDPSKRFGEGGIEDIRENRGESFQRSVYHPHGAVSISGLCVLTATDYKLLRGTLAFQLAVHAAFGQRLVIVGMSLEDKYLRDQITLFRDQITDVFWFVNPDNVSIKIQRWIWLNRINVVPVKNKDWSDFWQLVNTMPDPKENDLLWHWRCIGENAFADAECRSHIVRIISDLKESGMKRRAETRWLGAAVKRGEDFDIAPDSPEPSKESRDFSTLLYRAWVAEEDKSQRAGR